MLALMPRGALPFAPMDAIDRQYSDLARTSGLPEETAHSLSPTELQVLAHLAKNRHRIIAVPELAQEVFGSVEPDSCHRVEAQLFPVNLALSGQASLASTFTHYRGKLAVGLVWQSEQDTSGGFAQAGAVA